ncbi:hypothetical protein [Streptococcus gordonii]|uniref:Lipoprotein n=1 Tax=Streptococcus gordonii TaxID=1302 RepID=A0AAW3H7R5_STRGN|nr:hypothetical protein [Streptococcus gordonii]KJQ58871.1 hypothetical protein TZ86_00716 [Streptococcus gordonii]
MKKYKHLLYFASLVIILISFFSLTGCSLGGETIPKNRTKEQYEFEKTFEPMFEFLEKDNIDLTGIKSYSVSVSIGDRKTQKESYEIFLNSQNNFVDGSYTIRKDEKKQEVHVRYENSQLVYSDSVDTEFDEELFNLCIKREYFESLEVKEVFRSSETELSNIVYEYDDRSELFNRLIKKYNLSNNAKCFVSITHSGGNAYNIAIVLENDNKTIQIDKYISIMKG